MGVVRSVAQMQLASSLVMQRKSVLIKGWLNSSAAAQMLPSERELSMIHTKQQRAAEKKAPHCSPHAHQPTNTTIHTSPPSYR